MSQDVDLETLVQRLRRLLDLTLYEARLYIALLQGAKDPKDASVKSGVPLPRIYDVIKVLEAKGMAYRDPNGWYVPVSPSSLAVTMIARLEEESRRKAREMEQLSRELESLFERPRPAPMTVVRELHNVIATALDYFRDADRVYIVASSVLTSHEVLMELVKALAPHVPVLRVMIGGNVESGPYMGLSGVAVKEAKVPIVDELVSRTSVLLALTDPSSGELVGIAARGSTAPSMYFSALERLWDSLDVGV